jgi:hypothetical protein
MFCQDSRPPDFDTNPLFYVQYAERDLYFPELVPPGTFGALGECADIGLLWRNRKSLYQKYVSRVKIDVEHMTKEVIFLYVSTSVVAAKHIA